MKNSTLHSLCSTLLIFSMLSCVTTREVVDSSASKENELLLPDGIRGDFDTSAVSFTNAVVKVYYATNRNIVSTKSPNELYGTERSNIKYGECVVSIPRDHRMGVIERPSIWRLELKEDLTKHIALRKISVTSKGSFFRSIKSRTGNSKRRTAFIFIHGYNVSFPEAALTTAQLAYDLGFDGLPVFYSWPSKGSYLSYPADEATSEACQESFRNFLKDFISNSGVQDVFIIAHSMGNRILTRALTAERADGQLFRSSLREIILAAPDIDKDLFKQDLAPKLVKIGRPITLYVSSTDRALIASSSFHGGVARAGDVRGGVLGLSGLETIDATNINTSLVGHSYFADTRSLISDIFNLVNNGLRPSFRPGLQEVKLEDLTHWVFKK